MDRNEFQKVYEAWGVDGKYEPIKRPPAVGMDTLMTNKANFFEDEIINVKTNEMVRPWHYPFFKESVVVYDITNEGEKKQLFIGEGFDCVEQSTAASLRAASPEGVWKGLTVFKKGVKKVSLAYHAFGDMITHAVTKLKGNRDMKLFTLFIALATLLGCSATTESFIDKGTPAVFNQAFLNQHRWQDYDLNTSQIRFGYANNEGKGAFEVFDKVNSKAITLTSVFYKDFIIGDAGTADGGLTLVIKNPNGAGEDSFVIKAKAYDITNAKGNMEWFIEKPQGTYVDLKSYYFWVKAS